MSEFKVGDKVVFIDKIIEDSGNTLKGVMTVCKICGDYIHYLLPRAVAAKSFSKKEIRKLTKLERALS